MHKEDKRIILHIFGVICTCVLAIPFPVLLFNGIWFDDMPATQAQMVFNLVMTFLTTPLALICYMKFLKLMWKASKEDRRYLHKPLRTASQQ